MQLKLILNLKRSGPGDRVVIFGSTVPKWWSYTHANHKARDGGGCIDPGILNLNARWKCVCQIYVPAALSQDKKLRAPIEQQLVCPQRRCGRFPEDRNLLRLLRVEQRFLV
jgi:hypothetical protein